MENKNETPNKVFRQKAREQLKGNWTAAVLVCFVYWLILFSIGSIPGIGEIIFDIKNGFSDVPQVKDSATTFISIIIQLLIGGPLAYGLWNFFINLARNNSPKIEDLFKGFKFFGTTFLINLIVAIFQFLWSMLCMVPLMIMFIVVIAKDAYEPQFTSLPIVILVVLVITVAIILNIILLRYSMAFLVFNDNKELGVMDAIKTSVNMMKGYKFKLFLLYLSFIGWYLLSILTIGIGFLWLVPYMKASVVNFYEELANKDKDKNDDIVKTTI